MSRLFLKITLNTLRSPRGNVELTDDDKIVPALASIADGTLAVNGDRLLHKPHGKSKFREGEEEALSRQRIFIGPLDKSTMASRYVSIYLLQPL